MLQQKQKAKVLQSEYCDWIIGSSTKMIKILQNTNNDRLKFPKIKNMTESIDSLDSIASHSHIEHADGIISVKRGPIMKKDEMMGCSIISLLPYLY